VVELTAIYRLAPDRDFSVSTEKKKTAAPAQIRLPQKAEELFPYDVVIIGKGFEEC